MRLRSALLALLLAVAPAAADPPPPTPDMDLAEIAGRISERYRGRLMSVELDEPEDRERRLGARVIYEAEYLTPGDNLLTIRIDGDTGAFLLVEGVGQGAARIAP